MEEARKQRVIRAQAGFQEEFVRSNVDVAFGGGVLGGGKGHPLHERILTPNGWVACGDLKVGQSVCTPFGVPSKIVNIFDHKGLAIYKVTMNDGRVLFCDENHLWSIRAAKQLEKYSRHHDPRRNLSTISMSELIDRYKGGKKTYIPIPDAQDFPAKEYLIPPYTMGVLIGDGCLTDKAWVNSTSFVISNTESDIIERVKEENGCERLYRNGQTPTVLFYTPKAKEYRDYCRNIGLATYSYNKFIPQEYLFGSVGQRKQLLFGLMDTDGHIDNKGRMSFSTTSTRLAHDFVDLCRSLGMVARISVDNRIDKYTSGVAYDITISTKECVASSKKHLKKYTNWINNSSLSKKDYKHVYVKRIEYIDHDDSRCISIDDPMHLYIAGDYVTTHNTFGAVLAVAQPSLDPNFRAVFLRNNLGDLKGGGSILDTFKDIFDNSIEVVESGEPRVTFPSGAKIDVTHVADQTREKVLQRFKGRQYDLIYFDELTGFTFECFAAICTRNRGKAQWTGKVRATTNPERNHWLRTWLDWYIGIDGFIREDRAGVVRYFYMAGETVKDVVWGDSKEEVYAKCRIDIDRKLAKINGKTGTFTYKNMIKSFTFYLGKMSENKALLEGNDDYVGSVAIMGGRNAQQLLEGNWNVSPENDMSAPISAEDAMYCFSNDEQRNGDRWITCDLADTGTDNFLAIAWDGFHIIDILVCGQSTPRQNALMLKTFAAKHDVADCHIIYDAIRGVYINDYIKDAVQFVSYRAPMGMYGRYAVKLKDECYMRLVECIKSHNLSFSEELANKRYEHANLNEFVSIENEFIEECAVVRFDITAGGKKTLWSKKKMNQQLGRNRSMDLLDPCAMRMLPVLEYAYGEELEKTSAETMIENADYENSGYNTCNIFDQTIW